MIRSDVPIRVRPDDNHIEVHGTEADHARFKAFVDMIHPPKGETKVGYRSTLRRGTPEELKSHGRAIELLQRERLAELSRMAKESKQQRNLEKLLQMALELRAHAERIESEADRFVDEADEFRDRAEEMREKAWDIGNRKKAQHLIQAADAIDGQVEKLEKRAQALQEHVEELEQEADKAELSADQIREDQEEETPPQQPVAG